MGATDEQIKAIISKYPDAAGNNTEFCLRFWEEACKQRGIDFPDRLKGLIREYKPEGITRKRREFTKPTPEQLNKEEEYHNYYA